MQQRPLGKQGLMVSMQGLGCMGMSWAYGTRNDAESIEVIHEAIDRGVNFLDTAEVYGPFENEKLVGRAVKGMREKVVIATKFGFRFNEEGKTIGSDSRPEHIREVVHGSLQRLDTDYIDLLYQHRVDPTVPIEEVVGVMAEFVKSGKVRYLGLSEASPRTLERAMRVHPISALQSEYSLWERGVEAELLPKCRELGIGFVAYSPLGRGFLTGEIKKPDEFVATDNRRNFPRFQGTNFDANLRIVEKLKEFAAQKGVTAAQVALAWVHHQGADIFPIPGTKRRTYLRDNIAAAEISLTAEELAYLNEHLPATQGLRYSEQGMKLIDGT